MFFKKSNPSIHNNFLFKNVPPSEIPIKVRDRKFSKFKEGEIIYSVGDNSNFVYLLVKGQIKIKNYDIPEAGSIFEKSDDDYFVEIEFLNKTSRKTTAMAVKKSVVYLLDHKDINNLKKNKTIYSNLFNSPFIAAEPVQPAPNENIPPTENEYESNTDTASDQNNNELIDKSAIILNDEDEAKNVVTAEALESLLNDEVNVIDSNIDNNLTEDSTIKFDYTADDFIVDGNLNQQPDKNAEKTVDESIPRFDTGESV
ncbi:MAG: cyclic nucleotide-binding domain-containing protein, partial [Ignavibacteriaceae bacterium]|nr:cyclic nucleotide-binding domain-containing protein [Ignavibacteriaceae bacterium]